MVVFDKTDEYRFTDRGIRSWIHGPETMTSLFSWKRGRGRNGDVTGLRSCGVTMAKVGAPDAASGVHLCNDVTASFPSWLTPFLSSAP